MDRNMQDMSDRFNPRAREGRDDGGVYAMIGDRSVSIHAPARGATEQFENGELMLATVSIHAPARGATSTGGRL